MVLAALKNQLIIVKKNIPTLRPIRIGTKEISRNLSQKQRLIL